MKTLPMNRGVWMLSGLLAVMSASLWAGETGTDKKPPLRVVVEMADGSRLVGTPMETSLRLRTEYMKIEIPLAKVRQCEVLHREEQVSVSLVNGDKLTGMCEMHKFPLDTALGKLEPEFAKINRITFNASQPPGEKEIVKPLRAAAGPQPLNIDFGPSKPALSTQTGPAAAGHEGDFWNAVAVSWNNAHTESGLKLANGDPSPIEVDMLNLGGGWSNHGRLPVKSPMLDTYNYPVNNRGGNSRVILEKVPPGKYDLYIYGNGADAVNYGDYTVTVGEHCYGRKTTRNPDAVQKTEWAEGYQYVRFVGVKVEPGDDIEILIRPGGELTASASPAMKPCAENLHFEGAVSHSVATTPPHGVSELQKLPNAGTGRRLADAIISGLQLIPAD